MYDDVYLKLGKKNKILFNYDSLCLKELITLIQNQSHRILVLSALNLVQEPLQIVKQAFPNEKRPSIAFEKCERWAHGEIKMIEAKQAILACHSICKEIDNEYYIALFHAIGQGLSTVHVQTHAAGLIFYELTAIILKNKDDFEKQISEKIKCYKKTLLYYQGSAEIISFKWADFLLKDV